MQRSSEATNTAAHHPQQEQQEEEKQIIMETAPKSKDIHPYKAALNDLIDLMRNPKPKYFLRTHKLEQLKKLAQKRYADDKIIIEQNDDSEYPRNVSRKLVNQQIADYIQINASRARDDIMIYCNKTWMKQSEALEIFRVERNERNPHLVGQRGLRTKVDLVAGTVIGEYFGREFLENEFDDVYGGTKEFVDINEYALSAHIEIGMRHSRLAFYSNMETFYDCSNSERGSEENKMDIDENDEMIEQEFNIVIDGLNIDSEIKAMMIYMNDCRKDINMTQKTNQDQQIQNIKLTKVYHNGWPKIYAIALRNIEANSELITYYGKSHYAWEQDKIRWDVNRKYIEDNIHSILSRHGIDPFD